MALTTRQQRFVDEYLIDLNATQATLRAGYDTDIVGARRIGSENLSKPDIADAVAERMAARRKRAEISQDRVVRELVRIALSDIRTLFDDDGKLKHPKQLTRGQAAPIASVEMLEEFDRAEGGGKVLVGYTKKVKLWDKLSALEKLGKHLGMWKEKPTLEDLYGLLPRHIADALREIVEGPPASGPDHIVERPAEERAG